MAYAVSLRSSEVTDVSLNQVSLDDSSISESCSTVSQDISSDPCPSSEWGVIREFLSLTKHILPQSYINTYGYAEAPDSMVLSGKSSKRLLLIKEDEDFIGQGPRPVVATTPHAAIADAMTTTGALWFLSLINVTAKSGHGSPLSDQSDALHTIASNYSQPYSTVVCIPDSIHNSSDSRRLVLPFLPNSNMKSLANGNFTYSVGALGERTAQTIEHPDFTYRQALDVAGSATDYRLQWIDLPQVAFSGSSIGAVILLPHHGNDGPQDILSCNLSAGWGAAALLLETQNGATSVISSKMIGHGTSSSPRLPISQTKSPPAEGTDSVIDYRYPTYPRQLINISQSWAKYLNPSIPNQNTSVINVLMQQEVFPEWPFVQASRALAGLLVNGLARTSFESQLQGDVKTVGPKGQNGLDGNYWLSGKGEIFDVDPIQSKNWVTLRVDSTLKGYAYNTKGVYPRIAIAFLTIYCVLAIAHILYCGLTGMFLRLSASLFWSIALNFHSLQASAPLPGILSRK